MNENKITREHRLAEALRDNLRRRKVRARGAAQADAAAPPGAAGDAESVSTLLDTKTGDAALPEQTRRN